MPEETWKTEPPTKETLVQFNEDFLALLRKHKLLAGAVILEDLHPEVAPGSASIPPGQKPVAIRIIGDDRMVKLLKIQFGLLRPKDL